MRMNSTRLNIFTNQLWKTVGLITVWNSKHLLKTQDEREIVKSHDPIRVKLFNLNTINIKISYSSMPNVKNLIKQHNLKILSKDQDKIQQSFNCRIKEIC